MVIHKRARLTPIQRDEIYRVYQLIRTSYCVGQIYTETELNVKKKNTKNTQ